MTADIGIGSNLADPVRQVGLAIRRIAALAGCTLRARSSLYGSAPLGPADQPDYVNAVVAISTDLDPHALLARLREIEHAHGRPVDRTERWGARVIDLDLLLHDAVRLNDAVLTLPHPGIGQREFVLRPLREIAPDLRIPGLPGLDDLLRQCPPPPAKLLEQNR